MVKHYEISVLTKDEYYTTYISDIVKEHVEKSA